MTDTSRTRTKEMPNPKKWREVPKDDFFEILGPLDVHPRTIGPFPYTSEFRTPAGFVRGIAVDCIPEGEGLEKTKYFLPR